MKNLFLAVCSLLVKPDFIEAQIDPKHAVNLTLYHVHPRSVGAVPVDMDLGDVDGDLFFYLGEFLLPIECSTKAFFSEFDCTNFERVDPNLIISEVMLEVDSRWTNYSACNYCNGTDPFSGKSCPIGTYVCDQIGERPVLIDRTRVGRESVKEMLVNPITDSCANKMERTCGSAKHRSRGACAHCVREHIDILYDATCHDWDMFGFCMDWEQLCTYDSPELFCWRESLAKKTGGLWYSTRKEGQCNASSIVGTCSWRVLSTKSIQNSCMKHAMVTLAESNSPSCFRECGPGRNVSTTCWIGCFMDTILGPDARHSTKVAGLGMKILEMEWKNAFSQESHGGCPRIPNERAEALVSNSFDDQTVVVV